MINLPDFSKCVEFQRLREKMGITVIPHVPIVEFIRKIEKKVETIEPDVKAIQFSETIKSESVETKLDEITPDKDGFLTLNGRKIAAYIRDQSTNVNSDTKFSGYKYHLFNCSTICYMRGIGRERRYLATQRSDGFFIVYDISMGKTKKFETKLGLCLNCSREMSLKGFFFNPFSLKIYFEKYDSYVPKTIRRIETVIEVQNYTPNQEDLSREYRKAVKYTCQACGVEASSEPGLLHLHHRNGDRSDNSHMNLSVLCIDCHVRQPLHHHIVRPKRVKEKIRRIKKLRIDQGIVELDLNFANFILE